MNSICFGSFERNYGPHRHTEELQRLETHFFTQSENKSPIPVFQIQEFSPPTLIRTVVLLAKCVVAVTFASNE